MTLNASALACPVLGIERDEQDLAPVLLAHRGVGAGAALHAHAGRTQDAQDVLEHALREHRLQAHGLV
jgi:hypothetical protein